MYNQDRSGSSRTNSNGDRSNRNNRRNFSNGQRSRNFGSQNRDGGFNNEERNSNNSNNSNNSRRRFGGNGGGFNRNNRGGNFNRNRNNQSRGGSRFQPQKIDIEMFIRKAAPQEQQAYVAEHKFTDFDVDSTLKTNIVSKGYVTPTPIQDRIIPLILQNKDVIGIANTGTGKTAAFLIPLINKVIDDHRQKVMIIVPTRELAVQIKDELFSLTKDINVRSTLCIGGADIKRQIGNLKRGCDFVIATPGRLKDLVDRKAIHLANFNNIVLDEVDRMLDMGFYTEIKYLIDIMPFSKQSMFFSATLDKKIEELANGFLKDPEKIVVKSQETSANVDQDIVVIEKGMNKLNQLHELLTKDDFVKILIFSKTKRGVERLHEDLAKKGHRVESIHGDKTQFKRQRALDAFKKGQAKILIATDVVARGIDVPNVSHVINYDLPNTYADYVHRIGRTGRGNKSGIALTFVEK